MASAAAGYYMDRYGVYFDRAMLRNVFATNYKEAGELLGWDLVLHLVAVGRGALGVGVVGAAEAPAVAARRAGPAGLGRDAPW